MSDDIDPTTSAAGNTRRRLLTGMGAAAAGGGLLAVAGAQTAQAAISNGSYYTFGPTRYVDTRTGSGGRISNGQTRTLAVLSGAQYTMAANVTVVNTKGSGYLSIYSAALATRPQPYSTINWQGDGVILANFTFFDLGAAGFSVYCGGTSGASTNFIIDTVGYFINNGAAGAPPEAKAWERKMQQRLADQNKE
jgi:hypothetical protein